MSDHDCMDHLDLRTAVAREPHGEYHRDEWFACTICGERFDPQDVEVQLPYTPDPLGELRDVLKREQRKIDFLSTLTTAFAACEVTIQ